MKTPYIFRTMLLLLWAWMANGISHLQAQSQPGEAVIAITRSGIVHEAARTLQARVVPLDLYPSTFKVYLENHTEGYVKVELMDANGKKVHHPVFVYATKGIIKYDMSTMPLGNYLVRVKNSLESQMFELTLTQQIRPLIEVKRGILARVK